MIGSIIKTPDTMQVLGIRNGSLGLWAGVDKPARGCELTTIAIPFLIKNATVNKGWSIMQLGNKTRHYAVSWNMAVVRSCANGSAHGDDRVQNPSKAGSFRIYNFCSLIEWLARFWLACILHRL